MSSILNFHCHVQHKYEKARAFRGVQDGSARVDLMIMDIPKGLPVPMVTDPASFVPKWNKLPERFVETIFEFASGLVHDTNFLTYSLFQFRSFCPRLSKGWSPLCGHGGVSNDLQGHSGAPHFGLYP